MASNRIVAAFRSFSRAWLMRSRMERDMDDEMRFHLEARTTDLEVQGLSRAEAEQRARDEFGDVVRWKEAGRDARGLRLVDDLGGDVRYALRTLRRAPGFMAAAIVSLALGIGANTAIFGVVDLLMFRLLPVRDPHELVHVTTAGERGHANSGSSNYPWFREVASRADLFSDAMLVRYDTYKVGIRGHVEPLTGQRVTPNYYSLLGVPAILGRTFVPADQFSAGNLEAVISYGLWHRRFGGDPDVIGASITVDRQPYTIIGVTPSEFTGTLVGWTMDVTMVLDPAEYMDAGKWSTIPLIARVRSGVDIGSIGSQLDPMLRRLVATGVSERFQRRYLQHVAVNPAGHGMSDLREQFSKPMRVLTLAVGLLLLIACVNLAGLLVARNAARQHELGMRIALGAHRGRLVRQLLTESLLLALLGAVPGVLLGIYGGNLLLTFLPSYFGPVSLAVTADWRVLTFALSATVLTTFLFGLVPAWQAARFCAPPAIARSDARTSTARLPMGRSLVVAQFALSIVLLAGAAMLLRTLLNLSRVETGFDRKHVLIVQIDPHGTSYEGERLLGFQRDILAALGRLPGVLHVTLATSSPFNGNVDGKRLAVPGVAPRDPDDNVIQVNLVGPSYFDAFQVPILRGRPIEARDQVNTHPVAVVSDSFARRYFGDAAAAVGRPFITGGGESAVTFEIVGVARDVRYQDLRKPSERLVYVPWFQTRGIGMTPFEFVIRTDGNPAHWIEMTRSEIQRVRPDAPILAVRTMSSVINDRLRSERLLAALASFFAIVALTLAAIGVYGLLAYVVAKRVPEIGVRIALGATPHQMLWITVRESLWLAAIGSAVGIAAAAAGLRVLEGVLFGLSPTDVTNLASAALILLVVSMVAAVVPARRAASVDPLVALRCE